MAFSPRALSASVPSATALIGAALAPVLAVILIHRPGPYACPATDNVGRGPQPAPATS